MKLRPWVKLRRWTRGSARMFGYPRFRGRRCWACSRGFAVLLAAVGLYGVLGQFVVQRTTGNRNPDGVGGATGGCVGTDREAGGRTAGGGAWVRVDRYDGGERLLASVLYGVQPGDRVTFVLVSMVLFGAAALAASFQARRAARVDPMTALR